MKTLSYYLYDEWQWNNHLQLVKKAKTMQEIEIAILDWRNDSGVTLHIVEANSAYSAKAYIRAKYLGWDSSRLPASYIGRYIQKIRY